MKKIIRSINAPAPIGPYNQAVEINGLLYVSGQIAINPNTNELITANIGDEAKQVMENISTILAEAGYEFEHIIKTTIFLTDMANFGVVNEVYGSYFETDFPARETVAVVGLPKNANVEISVVAGK